MAVANWSSSAMVKAVLLPLILVVLAMAAGASSTEDGSAVAKSGGRFSETPVGRKLLTVDGPCGSGSAPDYNCKKLNPKYVNAKCCKNDLFFFETQSCCDVGGSDPLKCGSCTTKCTAGKVCCSGVCVDMQTDKNNCGKCGNTCHGPKGCKSNMCDY